MRRRLVLIRHGTTIAPGDTYLGMSDYPLSESGIQECNDLASGITSNNTYATVYTSALLRAKQTAEILLPGRVCQVDSRLNEVDFGNWSGMNIARISSDYPDLLSEWASNPMKFRFPGGESVGEFIGRIQSFVDEEIKTNEGDMILVCHGGVIRFIICAMTGIDFSNHLAFDIRRPSLNVIDHDGNFGVLSGLNISRIEI